MTIYTMTLADARVARVSERVLVLDWDVTAVAAAKSWTLAVSDVVKTPLLDVNMLQLRGMTHAALQKITNTSNADIMQIQGGLSGDGSDLAILFHPNATDKGNTVAYATTAANNVQLQAVPMPYVQGRMDIVTSVPTTTNRLRMVFWSWGGK